MAKVSGMGCLAARCFAADGVRSGPGLHDGAGLHELFLVLLLAHEEADPRRDLPDAVADGQVKGVDLQDDLLKLGELFCHSVQMITTRRTSVQRRV